MRISQNPGVAIEQCLTWQYQQHGGMDPVNHTDYTPSGGKRHRITYDKATGEIKAIPWVRHETKSTRPGRRPTTGKVATGISVGNVLAAAFGKNQAPQHALLLRFLYDPDFITEKRYQEARRWLRLWVNVEACQLFPDSVGVVRRRNMVGIMWELMINFSWWVRMGGPRFHDLYLCQAMGFANKQQAHWDRDYRPLVGMVMQWLQEQENAAVSPVLDVLDWLDADEHSEKATVLQYEKTLTLQRKALRAG